MRKKLLLAAAGFGTGLAARAWYQRQREASLENQVVLITGGSRGLGLALAHEFARAGCRLAICALDNEELERARLDLQKQGAQALTMQCDVSDQDQVKTMIETVSQHYGGVDILVNNAGIITAGPLENMELQDFEEAMQVMFWGTVYASLAVLPQMRQRRNGRIVNISSIGGKVALPHLLPYSSAKFAIVGFSSGLHAEVARDGISVTTVCPGLMRTGSYVNVNVKGDHEKEFALFSLLDNLPGTSISVENAAQQIVRATQRGAAEIVLSLPAKLQATANSIFPGVTANGLGLASRFLPKAPQNGTTAIRGKEIQEQINSPLLDGLTTLGTAAGKRFNQPVAQTSSIQSLNSNASG